MKYKFSIIYKDPTDNTIHTKASETKETALNWINDRIKAMTNYYDQNNIQYQVQTFDDNNVTTLIRKDSLYAQTYTIQERNE